MSKHAKKLGGLAWRQCGKKKRYATEGEAPRQIAAIHRHRPNEQLRVYDCAICNGWHLTNQPKRS